DQEPSDASGGGGTSGMGPGGGSGLGGSAGSGVSGGVSGAAPVAGAGGLATGGVSGAGVGGGGVGGAAVGGVGGASSGGADAGGSGAIGGGSGGSTSGTGGATAGAGAGGKGMGGSGGAPSVGCVDGAMQAYFVDSAAGDDARNGTTAATAWRSLTPVNARTFQPGDRLCFKAGGAWTGQLAPRGSGSSSAPVVIGQYGSGAKPRIAAGASDLQALLLTNQQYWEINDLELTNDKTAPGDLRGISIRGRDAGVLNHIVIRNTFVHDVSGFVNWIGGDVADN